MKNIFFLLIAVLTLFSCKNEVPVDYAIVSGLIKNSEEKEIFINSKDRKYRVTIQLDEAGNFVDTIKVSSKIFTLYYAKHATPLYLEAGYNIHVAYDAAAYDSTLQFSGVGMETCNYLVEKNRLHRELSGERLDIYKLDEAAFNVKNNEIKTALNHLVSATEGLTEEFKQKETRSNHYAYLFNINRYERNHRYVTEQPDFNVSEAFLNELEDLDYTIEADYFYCNDYNSLVKSHFRGKGNELARNDSLAHNIAFLIAVGDIENEVIKNDLLFGDARYGITYARNLDDYYTTFNVFSTNAEHKEVIKSLYEKMKIVAVGQPSPKFTNYENYNGGTTSLDDLKGKFVYIDVWATWCGPCKAEIPYLKEVEQKYHGKNIEFVSLSVDDIKDRDKWRAMIAEKEMTGIQLLADSAWSSKFVQDYSISGIPHFILIGPDGKIVDNSAPRPSSKNLIELFNENNI